MKNKKFNLNIFIENFSSNMKFFSKYFIKVGIGILVIAAILSFISLWTIIYTYYEPYKEIALNFIKLINMGIQITFISIMNFGVFYFLEKIVNKQRRKKYGRKK